MVQNFIQGGVNYWWAAYYFTALVVGLQRVTHPVYGTNIIMVCIMFWTNSVITWTIITRYPLPQNNGDLTSLLFGGNYPIVLLNNIIYYCIYILVGSLE